MGKKLRVCLAMGGGVSLGSFSGSALTEALKLLIIHGKDSNDSPYDEVIVDGMSGASAGAIALTFMLRCLIDYKSMLTLAGENVDEDSLMRELAEEYFDNDLEKIKTHKHCSSLIALELAQKIQYKVWVEEVDSVNLYGKKIKKEFKANPNNSFSLLDRGYLESLAKKYLINTENININNRVLLDPKRVVFACSLTNLLPIQVVNSHSKSNHLQKNILKSTGSDNHSELRVIDFVFEEEAVKSDDRWLRFSTKPNKKDPTHFDIISKKAWSTISASALACAAFPVAFEPVLLKRYQKEFGGEGESTLWPKSFIEIQKEIEDFEFSKPGVSLNDNSFFGENKNNKLDYKSFNFPYIDGGTFNNEPIREAFKIGTFQDFGRDTDDEERLILFVDPIVRKEHYRSFKVSSFSPVKDVNNKTDFKDELNKLAGNVSNILNVLIDQGSIKEEHKIIDTKENFHLRKNIFDFLNANQNISENLSIEIINTAFKKVTRNLKNNVISIGTRDPIVYFVEVIRKSCLYQEKLQTVCINLGHDKLYDLKKKMDAKEVENIEQVFELLCLTRQVDKNAFAQAIFKVITDFSLKTEGKSAKSYKAAIMPINDNLQTIELPGGEIEAFGGFASLKARQYSFEFAKLSTLLSLKEKNGYRHKKNKKGKYEGRPFITGERLDDLKKDIIKKIEEVNFFDNEGTYSKDLKLNLFLPSIHRIKSLFVKNKFLNYFLLKAPFSATALLGVVAMPVVSAVTLWKCLIGDTPWNGSGFVDNLIKGGLDQVNYIALEPVTLSIISDYKLDEKLFIKCIEKDKLIKLKVKEHTFDSFGEKKRYQYFFKVYLAEYIKDEEVSPDGVSTKLDSLKVDSDLIKDMRLTLSSKVKVPTNIDGNLQPNKKRLEIQKNYDRIIDGLTIDKYKLPSITRAINDRHSLLHYSFKNINFHVNPILEMDIQKFDQGWYFKEQTESLDKKMLN